ncbi:hypothetical protein DID75_02165 [Candidatus Marinamargulisbacteria bacterium SCGC AG-410-N11]|nr:hypothetical protein DID75_02165 [Candidatus Marinamargulisbacteria bacterium SCGC AG-410-N11]
MYKESFSGGESNASDGFESFKIEIDKIMVERKLNQALLQIESGNEVLGLNDSDKEIVRKRLLKRHRNESFFKTFAQHGYGDTSSINLKDVMTIVAPSITVGTSGKVSQVSQKLRNDLKITYEDCIKYFKEKLLKEKLLKENASRKIQALAKAYLLRKSLQRSE